MRRPWVRASLAGLAALVALALLATVFVRLGFVARQQQARRSGAPTPKASTPVAAPTPAAAGTPRASAPTPAGTPAPGVLPGTLVIPKIAVKAPIEQVTVDSHENMAAPKKPTDVGWYSPGVVPGQQGDAVIDGHLDWYGVPQAVFFNLDQLRAGDEVDVMSQSGVKLRFKVTGSTVVAPTAHPAGLFAGTGPPRLTLITCAGDWNPKAGQYSQRLLVDASYVGTG